MPMEKYTLADLNGTLYSNIQRCILLIIFLRLAHIKLIFYTKAYYYHELFNCGIVRKGLFACQTTAG